MPNIILIYLIIIPLVPLSPWYTIYRTVLESDSSPKGVFELHPSDFIVDQFEIF